MRRIVRWRRPCIAAFARVHPGLAGSVRVDLSDYDLSRA
jgi:hypothetical protein